MVSKELIRKSHQKVGKVGEFDKFFVVWRDENGEIYEPFDNEIDAREFMVEKLMEGKYANMSPKDNLPKIYYSNRRK
jgi:hypothetical protein